MNAALVFQNYGVLPWERDGDFNLLIQNRTALKSLSKSFASRGYELKEKDVNYAACLNQLNCGFFNLQTKNWFLEIYGVTSMGKWHAKYLAIENETKVFTLALQCLLLLTTV